MLVSLIFKTPFIKRCLEMKLRFKNYAVIITIENRCIRFNNYNLNSLYKYDIAKKFQNSTLWYSVSPNITSKFRTIIIFISLANEIIIQIKLVGMYMIFHCIKLNLSQCNVSWIASIKENGNINFQQPAKSVNEDQSLRNDKSSHNTYMEVIKTKEPG
jgi:hypothetical protein